MFGAILASSGKFILRTADPDNAGAVGREDADCVAIHLHGEMPCAPRAGVAGLEPGHEPCSLVLFGNLTADHEQLDRVREPSPDLILRGLPAPLWVAELDALCRSGGTPIGSRRVLPPLIPDWDALPASCFRDPAEHGVVLVRTTLGVADAEAGCGLTAFEGPQRRVLPERVVNDLERLQHAPPLRAVVVDPALRLADENELARWLQILDGGTAVASWTLPIADLGQAADARMRRLRQAGVTKVRTRLLSTSPALCEALSARSNPESTMTVLQSASEHGIATELMLAVGAPGETAQDVARTAAWLEDNAAAIDSLVLRTFAPEPGSEMIRDPRRYGIWWVSGGQRDSWADRRGSNLTARQRALSELAVLAEDLGIECRAPTVNLAADVMRRRAAVVRRYRDLAATIRGDTTPTADPATLLQPHDQQDPAPHPAGMSAPRGPRLVEIELSAACNLRCIGCWCHSELLGEERHAELQRARPLPTARIIALLDELNSLGVQAVQLSGSGEPLMNRDTATIIGHASSLGLETTLVTNGVLLDGAVTAALAHAGLDMITVSLWAGDPATYQRTHPGTAVGTFERLTGGLHTVAAARDQAGRPRLKLYHVISRLNCGAIEQMVDHALAIDADVFELQVIDLLAGTESELALTPHHVAEIETTLRGLRKRPDFTRLWMGTLPLKAEAPPIVREEVEDFGRFMRLGRRSSLFTALPGNRLRCRRGLTVTGSESSRRCDVEFIFPHAACSQCDLRRSCFADSPAPRIVVPTLEVTGIGSFLRRTRAAAAGTALAEAAVVRNLPCVVGDIYSRVDFEGNIIACCKGSSAPLGNIAEKPFAAVWQAPRYREFRHNARVLSKDDPYFAPYGCLRSCDNLGMNLRALYLEQPDPERAADPQ